MQYERGINQVKQDTERVKATLPKWATTSLATSPNWATTSANILRKTSFKIFIEFSKIDAFHFSRG